MLRRKTTAEPTEGARQLSDELGLLERVHAQGGDILFGAPTRCPVCGAMGVVDAITRGVQENGCLRCGERWAFSAKAVVLFDDAHQAVDQPEVVGHGLLVDHLRDETEWAHVTRERFVGMTDAFEVNQRRA